MNNQKNLKNILIMSTCLFIMACNQPPNFADLCDEHPKICNEFKEDSWCKKERVAVGFANLDFKKHPKEIHKFNQLTRYENYAKCMEHASKIEHIKLKEKQSIRIKNVINAKKKIKEISDNTINSKHPNLLYYHWSRHLNNKALQEFLALEGTKQLETADLQLSLATYYAKRDNTKTLSVLYHALELTNVNKPINTEIFESITTLFAKKNKYKQVYIWSKILIMYSPEDTTIDAMSVKKYAKTFNLNSEFLDKVASKTLETILEGKFKKP